MLLLDQLLTQKVDCLFASPNCSPWGNSSRASSQEYRETKRGEETATLTFLAVACIFQFLLDRQYLIENSAYSDIFAKSPLKVLRELPYFMALLDQCTCGATLDNEFIRKRSHFQSSHALHHLQKLCQGGHKHLNLRGSGLAAAAAKYPEAECELIVQEAKTTSRALKGGRILGSQPAGFETMTWDKKITTLKSIAKDKGLTAVWDNIVQPWLTGESTLKVSTVISTPLAAAGVERSTAQASTSSAPSIPRDVPDLITPFDEDKTPWQYKKYSAEHSLWQGAALRRRAHPRRSNTSLGVCSVDLSGPHESTPRPGNHIHKNPCFYFLVLTVRPDLTAVKESVDVATQASTNEGVPVAVLDTEPAPSSDVTSTPPKSALIYLALLGLKSEADEAIKVLLAQINNDHANFPSELIFRLHSDQGGEFMSAKLTKYLLEKGIYKTTTAGYDPNANPAESAVGIIKRRARYLLGGNRLPTNWWGVAALAAAQLSRADAGLEEYPAIPFGTRVMVVKSPAPRNAFMPRAEPATMFGPCDHISGASWTYQHGQLKARTNMQPQGMSDDDLHWVKVNVSAWDPPDAPLPVPTAQLYDATTLVEVEAVPSGATRETATCTACICLRRKQKVTTTHTLIWGECMKGSPPPPFASDFLQDVEVVEDPEPAEELEEELVEELVEEQAEEEEPTASAVRYRSYPSLETLKEFPHACVA